MARDDRRPGAEDRPAPPDLHRRPRPGVRADRSALVATWTLTVRTEGRVERRRFDALDPALDALATRLDDLAGRAVAEPADTRLRRYGPERQVVARIEVSGPQRRFPNLNAGVDVHGDGSTEAYLGRIRRRTLDPGADPIGEIRRALQSR